MRRSDREITDFSAIIDVIKRCDVCRIALNDGDFPYIVPLNFGMSIEDEKIVLYFHSANEGKKLDLIARDNRAAFEMDCAHELVTDEATGNCTMNYECVMGQGTVEILSEAEKLPALRILMSHYRKADFPFNESVIPKTTLFKLTVASVTAKARKKRI